MENFEANKKPNRQQPKRPPIPRLSLPRNPRSMKRSWLPDVKSMVGIGFAWGHSHPSSAVKVNIECGIRCFKLHTAHGISDACIGS
jgi:hypothetical protein